MPFTLAQVIHLDSEEIAAAGICGEGGKTDWGPELSILQPQHIQMSQFMGSLGY